MKALILAAGMGERLQELTADRPKSLVNVCGRPLLSYVLGFLDHPCVSEIGIVGGYKFELLTSHLQTYKLINLQTYFNPDFREGSVRTIMTAADFLDTDFLLLNTDHIYPKAMMKSLLKQLNGITAMCDFDRSLLADDMKVKLNGTRHLIKIRKDLKEFDCGYIGMTYVPKESLAVYKKAINDTYEIYGPKSPVEFIVGHMAANDVKINIADLSGLGWLEVDTKEDLKNAERALKS